MAKDLYVKEMKQKHFDFQVVNNGFVINPTWLYIGTTPDGIVSCTCCGRGVLEIKCPYCHKGVDTEYAAAQDKKFCLKPSSDGSLQLHKADAYFYQVQSQLFVCGVEHCQIYCQCVNASFCYVCQSACQCLISGSLLHLTDRQTDNGNYIQIYIKSRGKQCGFNDNYCWVIKLCPTHTCDDPMLLCVGLLDTHFQTLILLLSSS